jgi:hypothetical protein
MIKASHINKEIRSKINPILEAADFSILNTRENWRYQRDAICVLNIRAVGGHFSTVTGWPGQSLLCHIGIYFTFFPSRIQIKSDPVTGNLLPSEASCHLRLVLKAGINQTNYTGSLRNPPERTRTDLWWIDPTGSNLVTAITDLGNSVRNQAIPFFDKFSSPSAALAHIETERDCFQKFNRRFLIAEHIKHPDTATFRKVAQEEAERIQFPFPY